MKKIMAVILCVVLIVGFTGCKDKQIIDDVNPPTNVMYLERGN